MDQSSKGGFICVGEFYYRIELIISERGLVVVFQYCNHQYHWKNKKCCYLVRCLTETELRSRGREASNQVARLQGLLKDKPQKLALKRPGMALPNIPPLNVVLNPSVDTEARLAGITPRPAVYNEGVETNKGFQPGPFLSHAWILERNKIPAVDYEHDKFNKLKGHDFK